jgi:hypothetical protein
MRIALKLRGTDANGKSFEELTATENVSAEGFLCNCAHPLVKDAVVDVFLVGATERFVGRAKIVRKEAPRCSLATIRVSLPGEDFRVGLSEDLGPTASSAMQTVEPR